MRLRRRPTATMTISAPGFPRSPRWWQLRRRWEARKHPIMLMIDHGTPNQEIVMVKNWTGDRVTFFRGDS